MALANDLLAYSLTASRRMVEAYFSDLNPQEYLHRITPAANCAAWILGHLILTDRHGLAALGATDLPELPAGFEQRYAHNETAPRQADFGDVTVLLPLFLRHRDSLTDAARKAPEEELGKPLKKPHRLFGTTGELVNFIAQHAAMHGGQVTLIRRSLGRPPLI